MDSAVKEALAGIDEAVEWVRRQREAGWPPLRRDYLSHIEAVERLPQNQSGADKGGRWRGGPPFRDLARRGTLLRPGP